MASRASWCGFGLALFVLASVTPAQELSPLSLSDQELTALSSALGGDPFQLLRAIANGKGDHARRHERIAKLPEAARVRWIRAGLRGDSDVAVGAIACATWAMFDLEEMRYATRLTMPAAMTVGTPLDFREWRQMLDSRGVDDLFLARVPLPRAVFEVVSQVHRSLVPRHLAKLGQLAFCDDALLRKDALDNLRITALHTNQQREAVAAALLAWPDTEPSVPDPSTTRSPFEARRYELPQKAKDGWPQLLHAVAERLLLGPDIGALAPFRPWATRWALREPAGTSDLPLLARLARADHSFARVVAASNLRLWPASERTGIARVLAKPSDDEPSREWEPLANARAVVELVACGDLDAKKSLLARWQDQPVLFSAWCERFPDEAFTVWQAKALADAAKTAAEQIVFLSTALDAGRFLGCGMRGLPEPAWFDARLQAAFAGRDLDEEASAALLREFPGLRSKELCARYLEQLSAATIEPENLECLELFDAALLRRRLAAAMTGAADDPASLALLRLGAPELGGALAKWALAHSPTHLHFLARSRGKDAIAVVTAALERGRPNQETEFALLTALATLHGLDERLCKGWCERLNQIPGEQREKWWSSLAPLVLAGKPESALELWLGTAESAAFPGLGFSRAPFVTEYLRGLVTAHGMRPLGVEQLALLGDAQARAEIERVIEHGHYAWIDAMDDDALTDRNDLARIAKLIGLLESNCCLWATVASRLEDVLGDRHVAVPETGVQLRAEVTRAYFERFRQRLSWCAITDRYAVRPVPAVR